MSSLSGYKVDKYGIGKPVLTQEFVDNSKLKECPYCGKLDVPRGKYRKYMCEECNKRYDHFRKLKPGSREYKEIYLFYERADLNGYRTPKYKEA